MIIDLTKSSLETSNLQTFLQRHPLFKRKLFNTPQNNYLKPTSNNFSSDPWCKTLRGKKFHDTEWRTLAKIEKIGRWTQRRGNSKFRNKMYPIARGSRVEAPTIGIISIGWADFRLILVSRAPTYCNHADILCSCSARSPSPLHPPYSSASTYSTSSTLSGCLLHPSLSSPPCPSGSRSMPPSAADNSIILHAKTASDVLAQSASHLCEQITSYRKTDFIFEGRYLRYFFLPHAPLCREPRTIATVSISLCSASFVLPSVPQCGISLRIWDKNQNSLATFADNVRTLSGCS